MPTKLFISHSAIDEHLASALVDCILSSMVLDDIELRCTSVPGHKLPVGCDFAQTLMDDIGDSSVIIGLLTSAAVSSSWVLFELGATWGAGKKLKPLVADSIDIKALPGPLSGRHVAKLSSRTDMVQFFEEIAATIGAKPRTAAKSNKAIDNLMAAHADHMKSHSVSGSKPKIETKAKEPEFSGMPFSELVKVLGNESVTIPAHLTGSNKERKMSLFDLFGSSRDLVGRFRSHHQAAAEE